MSDISKEKLNIRTIVYFYVKFHIELPMQTYWRAVLGLMIQSMGLWHNLNSLYFSEHVS